jgi:hypothetical protein
MQSSRPRPDPAETITSRGTHDFVSADIKHFPGDTESARQWIDKRAVIVQPAAFRLLSSLPMPSRQIVEDLNAQRPRQHWLGLIAAHDTKVPDLTGLSQGRVGLAEVVDVFGARNRTETGAR